MLELCRVTVDSIKGLGIQWRAGIFLGYYQVLCHLGREDV